ncbi:hypothetical protein L7F22_045406 [Adiantum nelumboides]|nr:hypothetical protein [Adiantum nelumboides]
MVDNNIDVFKMFAAEDRLDGDNYPMWAYMMQHVLVSKGVWNIVQGIDVCTGSVDVAEVVDVAGPSTRIAAARKICQTGLDILAGLYAGRNEAKIAVLHKELESTVMNEEDDMDNFLAGVKDINEQLIFAGEIISDSSLVQIVLDALPDSYQTFASTWRLMNQRNPEVVKFDEVYTLLLQEALSKKIGLDSVQLNRLLLLLKEEVVTVMQPLLMVLLQVVNHLFLMLLLPAVCLEILVIREKRRCAAIIVKPMIT